MGLKFKQKQLFLIFVCLLFEFKKKRHKYFKLKKKRHKITNKQK